VDDLDELLRGPGTWIATRRGRVNNMVADMVFNHLRDESIERSPTGRDLLQNRCAIGPRLHCTLDRFQLAANASDPCQELLFFRFGV